MQYKNLNDKQIEKLKQNNCRAEDWEKVKITNGFDPEQVWNTEFYGEVKIGTNSEKIEIGNGKMRQAGIINSTLSNCEIGNNVYIQDVNQLSNYKVGDEVSLVNVGMIVKKGETTFGNGTEIEVLNEGGGRELKIFSDLNAQLAYLLVNYRHKKKFIEKINQLIQDRIEQLNKNKGKIQNKVRINNTKKIKNVNIGSHSIIESSSILEEGTIVSDENSPVVIENVSHAEEFIIRKGSKLGDDVIVDKCFIGESVELGKQFSAENSAIFANSEFFHGEGCSLLAGPFSVSHHKSSLIIASMISFYNAGSGTNQSNHMYKLGPLHQGVLERGCKTGSFSYLLWPSRVGSFSVIMDKHSSHFNTEKFPFSYIEKSDGESILFPAMNLATVGTLRDSRKWARRDARKQPDSDITASIINFDLFSPYTISKIVKALETSQKLYQQTDKKQDLVRYKGIKIKRLLLRTAKKYYKMPIQIFIGDQFIKQYEKMSSENFEQIKQQLFSKEKLEREWSDILGMVVPQKELNEILNKVEKSQINNIDELYRQFTDLNKHYEELAWKWTLHLIERFYNISVENINKETLEKIIEDWEKQKVKYNNMIIKDASKEFNQDSQISYGIDGDEQVKEKDFSLVRGDMKENEFIQKLEQEKEEVSTRASKLRETLDLNKKE